jgi:hypothetical protein
MLRQGHTSKRRLDSDPAKKFQTREKPGPEKNPDSSLRKPELDSWKPGLKIEKKRIQNKDSVHKNGKVFCKGLIE